MAYTLGYRCPLPLTPMENGQRFCEVCEKSVTNLCGMSAAEALHWLNTHPNACARLKLDTAGQLWAGALLLGALSSPAVAADPPVVTPNQATEIDGFIMDVEPDPPPAPTRLQVHAAGWSDPTPVQTVVQSHADLFRTLLLNHADRKIQIGLDGNGRVLTVAVFTPNPGGPPVAGDAQAIEQIRQLQFPTGGTAILVTLVPCDTDCR